MVFILSHFIQRHVYIKATIVAYAFSVQHFENTTVAAYAGLRVNWCSAMKISGMHCTFKFFLISSSNKSVRGNSYAVR